MAANYVGAASGINGWESTGISYKDYESSMHTQTRKPSGKRRLNTPLWAMNDVATRRVVLAYMEGRAFGDQARADLKGDERERLITVMAALKNRAAALTVVIDRHGAEYVACQDPARRKVLQKHISSYDRAIQLCSRPDVFYSVVTDYYRLRLNSVGVAERNGMSSGGVRVVLRRMNAVALSLGYEVECSERARVTIVARAARRSALAARGGPQGLADARRQRAKLWRATLVRIELHREQAGLCIRCGGQKDTEHKGCRACLDKAAARNHKHRAKRLQGGLCKGCGGQKDTEYKQCRACLDKAAALVVQMELRRKQAGLCKRCGGQKDTGYKRCRACHDKAAARVVRRQRAGLCGHCGGQVEPGRQHCRACLDRAKSGTAGRKLRRERAGLCKRCGGQRDTEYKKCRACLDDANVARRRRSN